jgi:hypothetical protein
MEQCGGPLKKNSAPEPYLFRSRPGMPERCPEIQIIPTLARIIWNFPTAVAPRILAQSRRADKRFFRAKTQFDTDSAVIAISAAGVRAPIEMIAET